MAATGDDTLGDEQRTRVQAAASAIAAGILTIAGGALAAVVYNDLPTVPVLGALRERLAEKPPSPSLKALQVLWYHDNALKLILVSIVLAVAAAAIGLALSHLYRSVKARRPELTPRIVYAVIAGAVLVAVSGIVQAIGISLESASFADASTQSSDAARDVLTAPVVVASLLLRQIGTFALGFGFILLALNAMRVGLLTRFMGVLGIIVGVLFMGVLGLLIPLGTSLPIVQAFWLVALGVLFLGRWPGGMPPAWVTGEAQPWPTQQELRERRVEAQQDQAQDDKPRRGSRRAPAEAPETPAPQMPERRPHPSSKKKKKHKRR